MLEMVASRSGFVVWLLFLGVWVCVTRATCCTGLHMWRDSPGCWLAEGFPGDGSGDYILLTCWVSRRQPPLGCCSDISRGKRSLFWYELCPLGFVRWKETETAWAEPSDLPGLPAAWWDIP